MIQIYITIRRSLHHMHAFFFNKISNNIAHRSIVFDRHKTSNHATNLTKRLLLSDMNTYLHYITLT
ncbi:hypothetical protein BOO88_14005 [Stutzerimonas stutzeri]|nr:hypothetical protein BOO89_04885 [Stutzerimonas stutzeri]AZO89987.1 hypothetical protein BOO88_14005 [Stutzerimonas stutzeri]